MVWMILLGACIVWPVLGWALYYALSDPLFRRTSIRICLAALIVILFHSVGISTRAPLVDAAFFTLPLLALICLNWLLYQQRQRLLRFLGMLGISFIYLLCLITATIGILGLMFAAGDSEPTRTTPLNESLVLKEYWTGNVTTEGGYEIEVVGRSEWFPGFERILASRRWSDGQMPAGQNVEIRFDDTERVVYLRGSGFQECVDLDGR
jgi:hypothetical protein